MSKKIILSQFLFQQIKNKQQSLFPSDQHIEDKSNLKQISNPYFIIFSSWADRLFVIVKVIWISGPPGFLKNF